MAKLESALSLDQILDGIRHLSEQEQRALAAAVLADPTVERFIEELDDSLSCERAAKEGVIRNQEIRTKPFERFCYVGNNEKPLETVRECLAGF